MLEETELYNTLVRVARGKSDNQVWMECFTQDLKTEIILLIQQDQLTAKGVDEAGRVIGLYSYLTELITKGRKQEGEHFTLDDTGSFYRSMFITVFNDSFVIDANSSTFEEMKLQDWYTDGILGLTDGNLQKVIDKIRQKYQQQMELLLYGSV
jgi:hypothetical protein